jgi:CBS domain containing-hemolysin-like protein
VSPDAILRVMVALIFLSGLLFAAHLGLETVRSRSRLAPEDAERRRRTIVRIAMVAGAVFMVGALSVVVWLIRG